MFGFGGFDFFGKFMRVFMCSTKQFLVGSKWSTCFSWKGVVSSSKGLDVVSSLISGKIMRCLIEVVLVRFTTVFKDSFFVDFQLSVRKKHKTKDSDMMNNIREYVDALQIPSQVIVRGNHKPAYYIFC